MKRRIGLAVAAMLLLAVVGVVATWAVLNQRVRAQTDSYLQSLSQQPLGEGGPTLSVRYEAIAGAAFPKIGVVITNPTLALTGEGGSAASTTWNMQGQASLTTDLLQRHYQLILPANGKLTHVAGDAPLSVTATGNRPMLIHIAAKDRRALQPFSKLLDREAWTQETLQSALLGLRAFEWRSGEMTWKDDASGAILYQQQQSEITLKRLDDAAPSVLDLAWSFVLRDAMGSPEFETFLQPSVLAKNQNAGEEDPLPESPFFSSRAGVQQVDLAGRLRIGNLNDPLAAPRDLLLEITRFEQSNRFFSLSAPLRFMAVDHDGGLHVSLLLDARYALTAEGGLETSHYGQQRLEALFGISPQELENPALDREALGELLQAAVPTISTLGPLTLQLDATAILPQDLAVPSENDAADDAPSPPLEAQITLRKFRFAHQAWGLAAKGMLVSPASGTPQVDFSIDCLKCLAFTNDLFAKLAATQSVKRFLGTAPADKPHDAALQSRVEALLKEIGRVDASTGDIAFALSSSISGATQLNDKPLSDVMPKFIQAVMPDMAQQFQLPPEEDGAAPENLNSPTP